MIVVSAECTPSDGLVVVDHRGRIFYRPGELGVWEEIEPPHLERGDRVVWAAQRRGASPNDKWYGIVRTSRGGMYQRTRAHTMNANTLAWRPIALPEDG